MRHSSFWGLLDTISTFAGHIETVGDTALLSRFLEECAIASLCSFEWHSSAYVLDNDYIWRQPSLFDAESKNTSIIVITGPINAKEQHKLLSKIPSDRCCIVISEKKSLSSWPSLFYKSATPQEWLKLCLTLTGHQPDPIFYQAVASDPWVFFDYCRQLRLFGSIIIDNITPAALSNDAWKKFAQLRGSTDKEMLIQSQDWHQILYCCEMIQQRALSASYEGFYIPADAVNFDIFNNSLLKKSVSDVLLPAYHQMMSATMRHHPEDFIWGLTCWFQAESALLQQAHKEHESVATQTTVG
jgi:hypothetical protein